MVISSKRTGIDTRAAYKRRYSDPVLNLNQCKACGASNPYEIGGEIPEKCDICGTKMEGFKIERPSVAFTPLKVEKVGDDQVRIWRNRRKGGQRSSAMDKLDRVTKPASKEGTVGWLGPKKKRPETNADRPKNRRK